jgi:hypothetical protein
VPESFKVVGSTDAQIISDCFKNLSSTLNKIQAGIIANVTDPAAHNALTARIQFGDRRREHRRADPCDATAHAGAAGE